MQTAIEQFHEVVGHPTSHTSRERGDDIFVPGEIIHVSPLNMRTYLDFWTEAGPSSQMITPFFYYLGRNRFVRYKIYEWSEVSPVNAQYYQITMQQKQQLEAQIKQGLAGISSSISDFDLLFHDQRKYREFIDYFEQIEKGKKEKSEELVMKNEQTLKSIFIDQVDVHTGEGIALKLIASRWPTIIVDFLKLKDEDTDPKKIAEKLKVTEAEGVVLATKNKLYNKWKELFRESVLGRYNRVTELLEARRKSIQAYRDMLRPIIDRFRNIREMGETEEGRNFMSRYTGWVRRAVSEAFALDVQMIWCWKGMSLPDLFKRSKEAFVEEYNLLKYPKFPKGFQEWLKAEMSSWPDGDKGTFKKIRDYNTGIEPLDKYVMAFIPKAEEVWKVKLNALDVLKARAWMMDDAKDYFSNWPYFKVWEFQIVRGLTRYADGLELENPMFFKFQPYLDTQNVILMRYIELVAKRKNEETYITDLLGETTEGRKIAEIIHERYPELSSKYPELFGTQFSKRPTFTEKEMKKVSQVKKKAIDAVTMAIKKWASSITRGLIKSAPYELSFENLITRQYFREIRDTMWVPANNYIRSRYNIPGFKSGP